MSPVKRQLQAIDGAAVRAITETDPTVFGQRIKALREAMHLSLRDLAERSGVSAPMLSQVERGETSPTITTAARIASGLDLTLSQLLRLDETHHVVVVKTGDRRQGAASSTGHTYELLTPPLPGQRVELSEHRLKPAATTGGEGDPPIHEPGSRETVTVQSGTVDLIVDGERHRLGNGDSVTFDADLSHHFENPGKSEAVFLAVTAAGLRRG